MLAVSFCRHIGSGRWIAGLILLLPLVFITQVSFAQTKQIHLRNERIQTSPVSQAAAAASALPEGPASGLFLIQFTNQVQSEWQAQLQSMGVELLRYVPDDAFVVRLRNAPPGQVRRLPYVRWVGNYRAEHKLHPSLKSGSRPAALAGSTTSVSILLS